MIVEMYLYLVTLIPAASAVAGFSPTARSVKPTLVFLNTIVTIIAIINARYTSVPYEKNN